MGSFFGELKRRNVVRVGAVYIIVGWVVVQIGQVLFESFGTPDWVIKTVIVLVAIGFPFVLLFAWAFEITPEGVKKTREVDLSASLTHSTGKKLNFVIMASLVIALGYFIWERQTLDRSPVTDAIPIAETTGSVTAEPVEEIVETTTRSIAVLPFVNMSSDQDQEWFADGLTEEILNSLAKTPDLLVTARTTAFGFKGSTDPVPEIAAALGVDHVLEGSVRRGGETLRITAQLIRASDGFHLWSETYDRTMDDVIAIQEEIAVQIASALETAMDPEALAMMMSVGTTSVPAYDAYLTGVGLWRSAGATSDVYVALDALEALEKAVTIDPEFAEAYLRLYWFWVTEQQTSQMLFGLTQFDDDTKIANRDEALANAIRFQSDPVSKNYYRVFQIWENGDLRRAYRLLVDYRKSRPNDEESFGSLIGIMRDQGLHSEVTLAVKEMVDSNLLTLNTANQALQGVRTVEDAEFMRTLAHESIEKFSDQDASLIYQAHRQLLWASDIDGASLLLPRIVSSELKIDTIKIAELRQLCAEQRIAEAEAFFAKMIEDYPGDVGITWLGAKIVGHDDDAKRLFTEFDEAGDIDTLMDYINYPHFDPKPFPKLMKHLAGQGMEEREVLELPYRCNR
jgi:TolB-like protein